MYKRQNGTIDSIDEWGKRRLAYPINDEEEGVYEPVTQKGALGHDPKEPLDEIILKINEKFKGCLLYTSRCV